MEEILIPMEVKYHIESIEFSGVKEYQIGDIYYYNPDRYIDMELSDSGFFNPINSSKCNFYCNTTELDFNGNTYEYGELLDIENVAEDALDNLCFIGYIKKKLKENNKEVKKEIKKTSIKNKKRKAKTFKYSDVAKQLGIAFKDLKNKASSLGLEIDKANDKISKTKMNKILEACK